MEDVSGENVSIDVTWIDNEDEKHNIYVTPLDNLTPGETYRIIISANLMANNGNTLGCRKL